MSLFRYALSLRAIFVALVAAVVLASGGDARADRVRDLVDIVGVRDNQLLGYGVVTGLSGSGDDIFSAPFAAQSLLALMRRLGVQVDSAQLRLRNVAAVLVTATLPPFARQGSKLDVTVSSIGNARSLQGGVLLQTPLYGADLHVYAVAQGPLVVGGFEAHGNSGSSVKQNVPTTARVPEGALIEREVPTNFVKDDSVMLALRMADFTTAQRMAEGINKALGAGLASAIDGGTIRVKAPDSMRGKPVELVARIGDIDVQTSSTARIVINERTGTIVAGGDVRLSPVAIAQGGLTIIVKETPAVSQPGPFTHGGTTQMVPQTDIQAEPSGANQGITYLEGAASLADVAHALGSLGVGPRELASILQALRAAGALRAEIVMQ